jgi:hypothetical protein
MFAQMFPCIPYLETLAFIVETKVSRRAKYFLPNSETFDETLFLRLPTLVRHIPRAVTTGGGWDTPNVVILQFCRTVLTILTTRSSGKQYVIQQKNLHNLLKSDSCRKFFFKNLRKYY